ncbi:MAG TPA: WbqC family protein [Chloroflexota bacterium]|nr:WbqC family protein [Chloroflexota bacterium]
MAIHQPEFLPWLGFFDKLRQADVFVLLDHVQFEKNYFQNRNRIRVPQDPGWAWLTVPVLSKGRFGQAIAEVEINQSVDWQRKHLAAVQLSYGRAPHFERYWPPLAQQYSLHWARLAELNESLIRLLAGMLGIQTTIVRSSSVPVNGAKTEMLLGLCQHFGATVYLSGISGRDYLDCEAFRGAEIEVRFQDFRHPVYEQRYKPFIPAMSAADLLFNCGPHSLDILADPSSPRWPEPFL